MLWLGDNVDELKIPEMKMGRVRLVFRDLKVETLADLSNVTDLDILRVRGVNWKTLNRIKQFMAEFGLNLKKRQ